MATPRKHYFKVADSIGEENWDNDLLATIIRLQARLNSRWARNGLKTEDAGRILLSRTELMFITRRHRLDVARTLASRLADVVSMSVEHRGDVTEIIWPKWPIFQGLDTRSQGKDCPEISPSADAYAYAPAYASADKSKKEEKEIATAARSHRSSPQEGRVFDKEDPKPKMLLMPDAFEQEDWDRLWRLTRRHDLTEDQVRYACRTVHSWSHGNLKKRADWVLVVLGAIRSGWALKGF